MEDRGKVSRNRVSLGTAFDQAFHPRRWRRTGYQPYSDCLAGSQFIGRMPFWHGIGCATTSKVPIPSWNTPPRLSRNTIAGLRGNGSVPRKGFDHMSTVCEGGTLSQGDIPLGSLRSTWGRWNNSDLTGTARKWPDSPPENWRRRHRSGVIFETTVSKRFRAMCRLRGPLWSQAIAKHWTAHAVDGNRVVLSGLTGQENKDPGHPTSHYVGHGIRMPQPLVRVVSYFGHVKGGIRAFTPKVSG